MAEFQEVLDRLLKSYSSYYNINTDTPAKPFAAEAVFGIHDEQYFLIKSAKLSESDSKEFVFFAHTELLNGDTLKALDSRAWEEGLSRAEIKENHKNTDVVLIILADAFAGDIGKAVKKSKHYKSYKFGLWGWSSYRLIAYELSSGKTYTNRLGSDLKRLFGNKKMSRKGVEK
ncbi:MAG: hypothetical protein IJ805_03020 [Lachnospiraceae bacterium]|nr:hypothetical protein [Lachnospiraceae bacterium]